MGLAMILLSVSRRLLPGRSGIASVRASRTFQSPADRREG